MVDYYKILDIQRTAASSDVKKAYRRLALKWHPDKNPDNLEEANKRFKEISEAYEVLIDDKKRRMYDQYGKEGVQMPGDKRRHDDDFDPFFATTFSFRNPDEVFREFFNGTPFQDLFSNFPGVGARRGVNRHMSTHPIDNSLSTALFSPFEYHSFFNNSFGGVPFTSFNTFPGFDATSGGMAGTAVKRTSTSTRFINGKQITTKKIYENGKETIMSYENDVLKSKTVNGVPQSIMLGESSTSSRQAPESPTNSTAACPNSKTVHGEHLKASRIKTHHHPLVSKKHDKRKGK